MSIWDRLRRTVIGAPKDVKDPEAFHKLSLVALLAWVGLGADGLSSSAYGPDDAFRALGEHTGLAVFLAAATAVTVFVISYGYSRIIEQFPSGGGGYVVASKILGPRVGVLSGSALLVDYVLTITISISAGADAIFSFLPPAWLPYKLPVAFAGIGLLTIMNLRGVKESVSAIAPIFGVFVVSHIVLLCVVIGGHGGDAAAVTQEVRASVAHTTSTLGIVATLKLLMRAYSMGGGTYTGIEAVSNGVAMMREPRVQTAKRTMVLMSTSLAITAGGIILAYLLVHAQPVEGQTMNAVLLDDVFGKFQLGGVAVGRGFVILALVSEGALLFVAAQAGFLDGPRVMANMATDSWLPHRFAALSERLTMRNGVLLMASAATAALLYTGGAVEKLVVLYSINVFLTFSLSNIAMTVFWVKKRKEDPLWYKHLPAHVLASLLCLLILVVTVMEKFSEGGWLTIVITSALTCVCFLIKSHYSRVVKAIRRLDIEIPSPDDGETAKTFYESKLGKHVVEALPGVSVEAYRESGEATRVSKLDPLQPVAVVFVGGYGGLGRSALLTLLRMFPNHFKGVVFASVAVVDSDAFKGEEELQALETRTQKSLAAYEAFGRALGLSVESRYAVGTEVAVEGENLGRDIIEKYPSGLVVAGQLIFEDDTSWNRALHNETAFVIQRRLQHAGVPMIVLPVMLNLAPAPSSPGLPPGDVPQPA